MSQVTPQIKYPVNLNVRMTARMYDAIDTYARDQELGFSEAARRLVGIGLDQVISAASGGHKSFVDEDDHLDQDA